MRADVNRESILDSVNRLRPRAVVVVSHRNYLYDSVLNLNEQLPSGNSTFIELDEGGVLVTEEHTEELVQPLLLLIQGLG